MRLAAIKPGDIVLADGMHAVVLERARGYVLVQGIGNQSWRRLRASEIEAHWKRARARSRAAA